MDNEIDPNFWIDDFGIDHESVIDSNFLHWFKCHDLCYRDKISVYYQRQPRAGRDTHLLHRIPRIVLTIVYMCFFVETALATMHQRDVTCMHFEKSWRGLLWEAFQSEGEGASRCKREG